jgi:hypothetical protein
LGGACFDPIDSSSYAIGFNNFSSLDLHVPTKTLGAMSVAKEIMEVMPPKYKTI